MPWLGRFSGAVACWGCRLGLAGPCPLRVVECFEGRSNEADGALEVASYCGCKGSNRRGVLGVSERGADFRTREAEDKARYDLNLGIVGVSAAPLGQSPGDDSAEAHELTALRGDKRRGLLRGLAEESEEAQRLRLVEVWPALKSVERIVVEQRADDNSAQRATVALA